ncbi:hypothetical protein R83H12_01063 [Fibrobacteria bacterium R8-3-H12]
MNGIAYADGVDLGKKLKMNMAWQSEAGILQIGKNILHKTKLSFADKWACYRQHNVFGFGKKIYYDKQGDSLSCIWAESDFSSIM